MNQGATPTPAAHAEPQDEDDIEDIQEASVIETRRTCARASFPSSTIGY